MMSYFELESVDIRNKKFTVKLTQEGREQFEDIVFTYARFGGVECEFNDFSDLNHFEPIVIDVIKNYYKDRVEWAKEQLKEAQQQYKKIKNYEPQTTV